MWYRHRYVSAWGSRASRRPCQCLRVDVLLDPRQLAVSNSDVEDPLVFERLIRGFDFPRSDADDQNPVSLRHEFGGLWVCRFYLFGRLLKHIRQSRVPAVRAGQRPVLARNDPLDTFGRQRQQSLPIAAAHCCKEILHNLDILLSAHQNLSMSLTSDRVSFSASSHTTAIFFRFLSQLDLHSPH